MHFRLLTVLFLVIAVSVFQPASAQEVIVKRSSVVEKYKGRPCYIHFVKSGETLTAIAKAYNISIEELSAENPVIAQGLKPDMVLRIPQKPIVVTPEVEIKPATDTKIDQVKPAGDQDYILYLVKKQETLYGISKQYNVSIEDILKANPGLEVLLEGMEIKIPKAKSAVKPVLGEDSTGKGRNVQSVPDEILVKAGETLYSIGKTYNVSVDDLIDLNPQLSEGLKAGMILKLKKSTQKSESKQELDNELVVSLMPVILGACYDSANLKKIYNIAILLPFLLDDAAVALESQEQKDPSEFENFNYFQFYEGFMLAADSLEKNGLHARIQVLDGDKINDTLKVKQALRKPGLNKMDLIVGPVYANSFSVAARFARKNEIGIVNPLSRRENIVNGNPFVVKTQASSMGIATKLSTFIIKRYPNANILVVRNDNKDQKELITAFTSQIKTGLANRTFRGNMQEAYYSTDMMAGVSKKLKPNVINIVIFFSNSKTNVPNFVSLLNPLSKSKDIMLMGMDGWEDLELETEFLVNLNFHQVTSNYIDYDSEAVKQFIARFRNKYGAVPLSSKHAYLGYDIGWYFLTSLMWFGDKYISCIPAYKLTGLQYNFNFSEPLMGNGLQNQNINIIKLQEYKMVKAD
jgi:LysM repeat protein/ABC-type branched-subunit amino acid transport system substrate-binding protein